MNGERANGLERAGVLLLLLGLGLFTWAWHSASEAARRSSFPAIDLAMSDAARPARPRVYRSMLRPSRLMRASPAPVLDAAARVQAPRVQGQGVQAPRESSDEPIQAPENAEDIDMAEFRLPEGPSASASAEGLSRRAGLGAANAVRTDGGPAAAPQASAPGGGAEGLPAMPSLTPSRPAAFPRLAPRTQWRMFRSWSGMTRRRVAGRTAGSIDAIMAFMEPGSRARVRAELDLGFPVWESCERAGAAEACIEAIESYRRDSDRGS